MFLLACHVVLPRWFTSMLGKKGSLKSLRALLRQREVSCWEACQSAFVSASVLAAYIIVIAMR